MISSHDNLRRVFLEGFSVQDIAEPLPSFDGTTLCEHVREIMSNKGFEVAGVRGEGITTGFVELPGLGSGCCDDVAPTI